MKQIHPVFHISALEPATPNTIPNRIPEPPQAIEVEGEEEFLIDSILDSKIDKRHTNILRYYVKWQGYEGLPDECTWIGSDDCTHAKEAVEDFHRDNPTKPGPVEKLKADPSFSRFFRSSQ